ncbi:leucine-rich repeat-containing protein [Tanacetum coccineum]
MPLSRPNRQALPRFHWPKVNELYLQSNVIQGPFPPSICNLSDLWHLDMSNNRFGGVIPQCVRNFVENEFQGTIPDVFKDCGRLMGLILNGNHLKGELLSSLSKCTNLMVLDLANNQLNGTFPNWLGDLPILQALVLRSNNFHGFIVPHSTVQFPFPHLQVLDISHNQFTGKLPTIYFQNFQAIKNVVKESREPSYLDMGSLYYSFVAVVKGADQDFSKVLVDYTIVDLSNNYFDSEIPNIIGNLSCLKVLNLSHNNLNGRIPYSLGNLSEIESLDLSWNQLTGEIPESLAGIKRLEVLSLSHNRLVGRIPGGTQFNTFEENSFEGNVGLCGFPCPKTAVEEFGEGSDLLNVAVEYQLLNYYDGNCLKLYALFAGILSMKPWNMVMNDPAVHHLAIFIVIWYISYFDSLLVFLCPSANGSKQVREAMGIKTSSGKMAGRIS